MKKNTLAVVMCTYNGEKYISEQLDSIINQTLQPDSIEIYDDCSTDNTINILQKYQQKYNFINIHVNKTKLGADANFINAIQQTHTDLIAPCDQDDVWYNNRLQTLCNTLSDNYDIVYCQEDDFYQEAQKTVKSTWQTPSIYLSIYKNRLRGHTCLFRKSIVWLYEYCGTMSWDYVLAIYGIFCNKIVECDKVLGFWRRHTNAASLYTHTESKTSALKRQQDTQSISNSYRKYLFVIQNLFHGNKHILMPKYLESRINFIKLLYQKKLTSITYKNYKLIITILSNIKKQTPLSIFIAGVANIQLYSSYEHPMRKGILYGIKRYIFAFKYPAIFWYESIDTPWLC